MNVGIERHKWIDGIGRKRVYGKMRGRKWVKAAAAALLLFFLAVAGQSATASAAKVYNNGGNIVECGGRIYFNQSGEIFSFDLKSRQKMKLVENVWESDIWIAGDALYYTREKVLYSRALSGGTEKALYKGKRALTVLGFAAGNKRLHIGDGRSVYRLTLSGRVTGSHTFAGKGAALAWGQGKYIIVQKRKTLFCGTSPGKLRKFSGAMKKLEKKSGLEDDWLQFLGIYGTYLYGYIYEAPGTIGYINGYLFQISLKNGAVKVYKRYKSRWEACEMRKGRIYTGDYPMEAGGKTKTHVFILNKKTGAVKHKTYACAFNGTDGRYFYQAGNTISRYDPKTGRKKVLDARYRKGKKDIYYVPMSTGAASRLTVVNGKLFYTVYDCRKEKYVGWRLMADLHRYYIVLRSGERVRYTVEKWD